VSFRPALAPPVCRYPPLRREGVGFSRSSRQGSGRRCIA
jgi:hypothetical protein